MQRHVHNAATGEVILENLTQPEIDERLSEIEANFENVKKHAVQNINSQAETQRGKYITLLPGKIGEYRQKEAEFERWQAAGQPAQPDAADYPIAAAECVEYDMSITEMLTTWGQRAAAWAQASARIAAVERRALLAIEKAQSDEEIEMVLASVKWPE